MSTTLSETLNDVNVRLDQLLAQRTTFRAQEANGSLDTLSQVERRNWQGRLEGNELLMGQCLNRYRTLVPQMNEAIRQQQAREAGNAELPACAHIWQALVAVAQALTRQTQEGTV
ncbi:MAG: hypothetical protein ACREF4_08645 [Gammaproteobacteria bacterium]